MMELKDGDVYRFAYNEATRKKAAEGWEGSLDHCFDGKLVWHAERGTFHDTYWGFDVHDNSGRRFTEAKALAQGTLTFICNLNAVEEIPAHLYPQYADGDVYDLSHQHGCHKYFVKLKGAEKSVEKQLGILSERKRKAKNDAEVALQAAFRAIELCDEQSNLLLLGKDVSI